MKVKTFHSNSQMELDKWINNFISSPDIEVIDIKFSTVFNQRVVRFSAMVIYKDKE